MKESVNFMLKKLSAVICIAISLVIMIGCFTLPASANGGNFSSLADWQGDLDEDTPITEINIPGTHDSAMFGIGSGIFDGVGFAHNQDLTFEQQLNIGVRYIDGRFCYEDEKNPDETENIFCCHGGYIPEMNNKDISLKDMLNELNKFLDKHPTEFIFLPYKCESEEDMKSAELNALLTSIFYDYVNSKSERYMMALPGGRVPTVKEAQGHIIFTINSNSGIFCDYCTLANTYSKGTDEKVKELSRVFDINNVRPLTKESRRYSRNSDKGPECDRSPRLIHTSCYQAPFRTPARTSADIYKWILGKVEKLDGVAHPTFHKGYYYGIVLFDYVKEDECRLIINLNNAKSTVPADSNTDESAVPATATALGDSEIVIAVLIAAVVLAAIITVLVVIIIKNKHKKTADIK